MATRRGNGEGNVRKRTDGRYEGRLRYVDPVTGDTVRTSFYGKTANEVRAQMRKARDRVEQDQPAVDARITVWE